MTPAYELGGADDVSAGADFSRLGKSLMTVNVMPAASATTATTQTKSSRNPMNVPMRFLE